MARENQESSIMIHANRRSLLITGSALMGGACLAVPVRAQSADLVEGKDYRLVRPAQPADVPAGKLEVLEFFMYGCPHCNTLEPLLKAWSARQPADVVLRKVHVPFGERRHQQLFCTLEAMGKAEAVSPAVFRAIHVDRDRLETVDKMAALVSAQGLDAKQFRDTFDSFAVRTRMRRGAQLAESHGVDGVPAFSVNGKFYTAPSMAGSHAGALSVVERLLARERKAS
jgi:thiol:disulfide interchange protein DsbA